MQRMCYRNMALGAFAERVFVWTCVFLVGYFDAQTRSGEWTLIVSFVNLSSPLSGLVTLAITYVIVRGLVWLLRMMARCCSHSDHRDDEEPQGEAAQWTAFGRPKVRVQQAAFNEYARIALSEIASLYRATHHPWFDTSVHRDRWLRSIQNAFDQNATFNPHMAARMIHGQRAVRL